MDISEMFWDSSIEDLKKGYTCDGEKVVCLICGKEFEKGIIYRKDDNFFEAEKYMKIHIENDHKSVFEYLINMNKKYTGLTDIQREFLMHYKNNYTDKEIAEKMGGSQSTIRNHRFKLREKEKQAKIFLVLMSILNDQKNKKYIKHKESKENLVTVHKSASMIDERFSITEKEHNKIIKNYFDEHGCLKEIPSKEKKKIVVLKNIIKNFKTDKKYTEKEINRILQRIHNDFASIRRALIEYGFMDRKSDCSYYWVKE